MAALFYESPTGFEPVKYGFADRPNKPLWQGLYDDGRIRTFGTLITLNALAGHRNQPTLPRHHINAVRRYRTSLSQKTASAFQAGTFPLRHHGSYAAPEI